MCSQHGGARLQPPWGGTVQPPWGGTCAATMGGHVCSQPTCGGMLVTINSCWHCALHVLGGAPGLTLPTLTLDSSSRRVAS